MVKIDNVHAYGGLSRLSKKEKPKAKSAFNIEGEADGGASSAVGSPQSAAEVASLAQLMQIQEVGERDSNTKQALDSGDAILKSLEKLQNEILMGTVSERSLRNIASITNTLPAQISDPGLRQLLAEIKQRAMVELAKIEMSR